MFRIIASTAVLGLTTLSAESACYVLHPVDSCLRANLNTVPCVPCGPDAQNRFWDCCYDKSINTATVDFARECTEPGDPTTYMDNAVFNVVAPVVCTYLPAIGCGASFGVCVWGPPATVAALTDAFTKTSVPCGPLPPC